jgi:DNA-binding IclR family transcriptional regulator
MGKIMTQHPHHSQPPFPQRPKRVARQPIRTTSSQEASTAARSAGTAHGRRVMQVVGAFLLLPGGPDHGPSEIAAATGLNTTVVYRILQAGVDNLFIRRPAGRYRLGPGAAKVGMQAMAATPGPETLRPVLEQLSHALDGFVQLWVLSPYGGPHQACIATAPGRYDFDALGLTATQLTEVGPSLRVGASGRVIAAHLPPSIAAIALKEPLPASAGPGAMQDPADFTASLAEVRKAGYAVAHEELTGWDAIAAPVMWDYAVYGAVSVLKPASLMPRDMSLPIRTTTAAAERLSLLVSGGTGPYPLAG